MLKILNKIPLLISLSFLLASCGTYSLIENAYVNYAPEKYAKSSRQPVYISTSYNVHNIYNLLFNDFLIIGESSFTAEYDAAGDYIKYGKKVGADIIIASFENMQKVEKYVKTTVPDEKSVTILDTKNNKTKSQKITIQKDKDVYIPYTVTNFDQAVLFLKRVDGAKAPWEYVQKDFVLYQGDNTDPYLGNWTGYKTCRIEIYSTQDEYLGFINEANNDCKGKPKVNKMLAWKNGDIKLRINKQSKQGFYLNQDKVPILIKSRINKFNNLELIDQETSKVIISFQKN
ncbi:hypothetical protein [Wolbachia endosymbiont of Folsomia candida]|uniref:hypothetical protein n=1 Tax=Wolbachia endosymbiont of Folsomia candida TaxID=169402 RepID=UPI000B108ED1|nr:hypothetical protein [Wolbachia endosymbiont of Folsomia candida]APR98721.1 hypothetical protein ASM33_05770 [Wolbachia endosymbiont of Folsomia candida]